MWWLCPDQQVYTSRTLLHTKCAVEDIFADPTFLASVQYFLNSEVHSETGYSPFELTFGSSDKNYWSELPNHGHSTSSHSEFLSHLNKNLNFIRDASADYQKQLILERTSKILFSTQNIYQKGDFVLFEKKAVVFVYIIKKAIN